MHAACRLLLTGLNAVCTVLVMNAISKAIESAGGPTALAKKLTELDASRPVSTQRVNNWRARGRVSAEFAAPVEMVTGVSRRALRPDIYRHPDDGLPDHLRGRVAEGVA